MRISKRRFLLEWILKIWIVSQLMLLVGGTKVVGYKESCRSKMVQCDTSKNLTCNLQDYRCVCAEHPTEGLIFIHNRKTQSCAAIPLEDKTAFWECEDLLEGVEPEENQALPYCKSHNDCSTVQHSECNLAECICECKEEHDLDGDKCIPVKKCVSGIECKALSMCDENEDDCMSDTNTGREPVSVENKNSTINQKNKTEASVSAVTESDELNVLPFYLGLGIMLALVLLVCVIRCIFTREVHAHPRTETLLKPYKQARTCVEICKTQFSIEERTVLGVGKSGIVYAGQYGNIAVAVKTLNPACRRVEMYLDSMCQEIEIFKTLGEHSHVVKMYAYCRIPSTSRMGFYLIMELCPFGSLKKCLRERTFVGSSSNVDGGEEELGQVDLLVWSRQIADGMDFLSAQKVVHGDLATRNVLVFSRALVKITDFGLARRLDENSKIYIKTTNDPIPWKWSPPEVIEVFKFSTHSDVWSFGVTLWEIFSFAAEPYKDMPYSHSFPAQLCSGAVRLQRPPHASIQIYHLMTKCWHPSPNRRISFSQLKFQLSNIHPAQPVQEQIDTDGYLTPI